MADPVPIEPARSRSIITRMATAAARRWQITLAVWIALVIGGIGVYYGGLAREGFPPVNVPIVVVDGTYFVDDPEQVDADVIAPLYERYAGVEGVKQVQTFAGSAAFALVVEFDTSYSSPEGAALLEAAGGEVPDAADVSIRVIDGTKFIDTYDILIALAAPDGTTVDELQAQAEVVAAGLLADEAIAIAEVRNLLTEGLDPATGEEILRQTRFTRVAFENDDTFSSSIAIGVVRNESLGLDVVDFSDRVNDELEGLDVLPAGYRAAVTADFANDIRAQLSTLTSNLLTGLIAVAVVSLLLIGWRAAIMTAAFMATVMLSALIALWLVGYSLNTITLFGLILTLGLLVDDAIVVSESIDANRDDGTRAGAEPVSVVRRAIDRVGTASFSGTLTTVLVFAPLAFVGGILGEFIRAIPITVIITLLLSFVFSMTLIPAIGRAFLLRGRPNGSFLIRGQHAIARRLGALAAYPSRNGAKGVLVGVGLVAFALAMIVASFGVAARVGFNIFPEAKDTNAVLISTDFDPGTTLDEAQAIADDIDAAVLDVLGDDLVRAQYVTGSERGALTFIDLTPLADRGTTSPEYVARLEDRLAGLRGARVSISVFGVGPPGEDFPFAVQIAVDDENAAAGEAFARELATGLIGSELDSPGTDVVTVTDALVSTDGQVFRTDGVRQIEVRAAFSSDDTTANTAAAESLVTDRFGPEELEARGLAPDALNFDFGLESDNQDDFASLFSALLIALGLMLLLLMFQFRSVVQPLLIFLAIPFSFLGVFLILLFTDNSLSFFVMVGFIALIGVVVNNTILLVDAANQHRVTGATSKEAIEAAVTSRFRPLAATTLTTVAGLLPLALSDPFWEGLSFTLIGGLLSSTLLVLVAFPVFYLAVEAVRTPIRNRVRARRGLELIP